MTALNVVRVRVKPGQEQAFIDAHKGRNMAFKGFEGGHLFRTGDRTFCLVGQWRSFQHIVGARPQMIAMLDETRGMLEDLGGGLGVTDPVSGESVVRLPATKAKKAKRKGKPAAAKRAAPKAKAKAKSKASAKAKAKPAKKKRR